MLEWLVLLFLLILVGYIVVRLTLMVLKWLAVNTVVGLILVGVLNFLGIVHIDLTPANLLIIAVGGVVGVFLVILMSLF